MCGLQALGNSTLTARSEDERRKKRGPRVKAEDMTVEQAASKLQAIWRARRARRMLRVLLASVYERVRDAAAVV